MFTSGFWFSILMLPLYFMSMFPYIAIELYIQVHYAVLWPILFSFLLVSLGLFTFMNQGSIPMMVNLTFVSLVGITRRKLNSSTTFGTGKALLMVQAKYSIS